MKKIISILLVLLTLLSFTACKKTNEETESNRVLLSTFSCLEELRSFKCYSYLNKIELNTNKEYVTDGDTSVKIYVDGENGGVPEMSVFTDTKWTTKKDFSNVQALSVEIYNTSTTARKMKFSFMTRFSGATRSEYTGNEFVLQPGYNKIVLNIDREVASQACYITKVEYIKFTFENGHADPYVLYMDNLQAHLTKEALPVVTKEYKEGELLFFDDKVDRYYITPSLEMALATHAQGISINRNKKFIRSGTGSLKITPAVDTSMGANQYSPGVQLTGDPVTRMDFSEYSALEFYVSCDAALTLNNVAVRLTDATGAFDRETYPNIRVEYFDNIWSTPMEIGCWYKLTIDLVDLEDKGIDLTNVASIKLFMGNNFNNVCAEGTDQPFSYYFDDFTIVK